MRAYLICPFEAKVSEVEHNGDWRTISPAISHETMKVSTFTSVRVHRNGDVIYVDDNGLLHSPPVRHFFKWQGYAQPLAGRGLVLGVDPEGDSRNVGMNIDEVRARVSFLMLWPGGLVPREEYDSWAVVDAGRLQ